MLLYPVTRVRLMYYYYLFTDALSKYIINIKTLARLTITDCDLN